MRIKPYPVSWNAQTTLTSLIFLDSATNKFCPFESKHLYFQTQIPAESDTWRQYLHWVVWLKMSWPSLIKLSDSIQMNYETIPCS